jgi:serine/threonine-protein kinase
MAESFHKIIGRYALFDEIASGGMATVHLGRLLGAAGFSRTVAIKRLHPQFAKDPDFVDMLVDEARLAARIRHPNVVPTLDVVQTEGELFLVMEYVQGEALSQVLRRARREGKTLEISMAVRILADVLHGLHAAHNARGESGEPLSIVHRDVSPHNILVGVNGVARVFDFGIAKASGRLQTTREGQIKGKLPYMAPEQVRGEPVGPETDVYAAGVVLWEALASRRLFDAETEAALLKQVLDGATIPPSDLRDEIPKSLDEIVMKALAEERSERYESAREMALALEKSGLGATTTELAEWIEQQASDTLQDRAARIAEIESKSEIDALAARHAEETRASRLERSSQPGTSAGVTLSETRRSVTEDEPPRRSAWLLVAAIGFLAVGGLGAALLLQKGGREAEPPTGASSPTNALATSPPTSSASPETTSSSKPTESTTAEPAPTASAMTTGTATAPPAPRPRLVAPPRTASPPSPPPPAPASDPCDNPFFVDAAGIKRIKPECR